jgi:predicted ester cyclase
MDVDGSSIARAIYEALNEKDFERAAKSVTEGVLLLNVATADVYRGRPGFLDYSRGWAAAFPDLDLQLVKIDGGSKRVIVEYELVGSQTGPLITPRGHIPPTGMSIQLRLCDVLDLQDGAVSHIRSYFDSSTLLRQLGLIAGTPLHAPERRVGLELYAQTLDGTASERNKSIVHRFIQNVFNRQDPGASVDTCSRTFLWHGGQLGEARGLTSYRNVLSALFAAFPDLQVEILDTIAEGDRVAVRFSMSGTHMGDFQGIAPTFRRISSTGANTYRVADDRIVEEWWHGDVLALMQQMDAVPSTIHRSS